MKEYGQSGTHRIRTADKTSDRDAKISREFNVATFNVRTLADTTTSKAHITNKLQRIVDGCEKYHIDIVCIQEHRLKTNENINYITTDSGWILAHTNSNHQSHGVAILYSKRISNIISGVVFKSNRIIAAHLNGNPKTCIIAAYAPTEASTDESEKSSFYNDLEDLISSIPPHTVTIVAGDFNARLGKDSHLSTPKVVGPNCYHDNTNENGQRLLNLCKATNLRPTHTHFEHKKSHLYTYQPPNENLNPTQIDHIMIN
jgi:exonuclease III